MAPFFIFYFFFFNHSPVVEGQRLVANHWDTALTTGKGGGVAAAGLHTGAVGHAMWATWWASVGVTLPQPQAWSGDGGGSHHRQLGGPAVCDQSHPGCGRRGRAQSARQCGLAKRQT